MNNPGNEAWIKSQEKVHEAALVSQARSKLLQNSMYPELSVAHAQIATHSPMMADLSEQCWWKGVFTRVLKELLQLERFTATIMGKQKITNYKTRTWRSKSYGLFFFPSSSRQRRCWNDRKFVCFQSIHFPKLDFAATILLQVGWVGQWALIPAIHREHYTVLPMRGGALTKRSRALTAGAPGT